MSTNSKANKPNTKGVTLDISEEEFSILLPSKAASVVPNDVPGQVVFSGGDDSMPLTASAFTFTSTTVGATSTKSGTLGLYDGDQLIGPSADFTSELLTQTVNVVEQSFLLRTILKVSDTSGNFATATRNVALGTSEDDSILGISDNEEEAIYGFDGNDTITGGSGVDWLTGGDGADVFVYNQYSDSRFITGPDEADRILDFETGTDKIRLSLTGNKVDVSSFAVVGGYNVGQSTLRTDGTVGDGFYAEFDKAFYIYNGGNGIRIEDDGGYVIFSDNPIAASDLEFIITGTAGVDTLVGGAGSDQIFGGSGADTLTGGAGSDHFVYSKPTDGAAFVEGLLSAGDSITDFTTSVDKIRLLDELNNIGGNMVGTNGNLVNSQTYASGLSLTGTGDNLVQLFSAGAATATLTDLVTLSDLNAAVGGLSNVIVTDERIFAFNSLDGHFALYYFQALDADGLIDANEITLLATGTGTLAASDFLFA